MGVIHALEVSRPPLLVVSFTSILKCSARNCCLREISTQHPPLILFSANQAKFTFPGVLPVQIKQAATIFSSGWGVSSTNHRFLPPAPCKQASTYCDVHAKSRVRHPCSRNGCRLLLVSMHYIRRQLLKDYASSLRGGERDAGEKQLRSEEICALVGGRHSLAQWRAAYSNASSHQQLNQNQARLDIC